MAGFYADVPGNRFAYDLDNTYVALKKSTGLWIEQTNGWIRNLNSEANINVEYQSNIYNMYVVFVFSELRDVRGLFGNGSGQGWFNYTITWSANATNPDDGTWNAMTGFVIGQTNTSPQYRTGISTGSFTGVKAIKVHYNSNGGLGIQPLHLYGTMNSAAALDRLELWHPTLDQRVGAAYFDWGDTPRNSIETRQFRIKNLSPTLTANSIDITYETITDTTPTILSMHTFSDGGAYSATLNIGTIAPNTISPLLTIKRDIPSNAVTSIWAGRIKTIATTWT